MEIIRYKRWAGCRGSPLICGHGGRVDEEAENGWPYRVASCKAYIYLWATSVVWRVASLSLLRKGDVADRGGGLCVRDKSWGNRSESS